ncbi:hypothetical protein PB01_13415 [Psychrobacillus glaciei]|uniref:Uncharacterized protein n=1 Tax=Psychrobacillus glaciei TaxID=2283160 RepID=A0A5J6SU17_9BACI|nr:hypothetical protein PB01_13415 [Psychrobacillus glaciei]
MNFSLIWVVPREYILSSLSFLRDEIFFICLVSAPCPSGSNVKKLLLSKLVANKSVCGGCGAASWASTMRVMSALPQDVAYFADLHFLHLPVGADIGAYTFLNLRRNFNEL